MFLNHLLSDYQVFGGQIDVIIASPPPQKTVVKSKIQLSESSLSSSNHGGQENIKLHGQGERDGLCYLGPSPRFWQYDCLLFDESVYI
jgi:hypothetical protein